MFQSSLRFTKPNSLVSESEQCCVYRNWCVYWTCFVVDRPAASFYSPSPWKYHATGRQWCPNPDHYPDSEQARASW